MPDTIFDQLIRGEITSCIVWEDDKHVALGPEMSHERLKEVQGD